MNNQRCISERSLITIRKWLREAGDGPSTSIYLPSSKLNHKIIKRKKLNYHSKPTSIINWFYEFIKKVFTVYDDDDDNTTMSIKACPTCQLENIDSNINNLNLSKSTQTNPNEQQSTIYPFYCFSVKDGQVIPLKFSSSKVIPLTKNSISSSSPLCLNNEKSSNCGTDPPISNIHHFDKRNCLIECCHSSSNPPDSIFAERTCQLIKQAWLSTEKSV